MNWIFFVVSAATIWACVEVLDKFIIDKEVRNPYLATSLTLLTNFVVLIVAAVLFSGRTSFELSWLGVLISVIYFAAIITYYKGLQKEEVSRFAPTLSITTVFIVIFAYLFLGESFSPVVYAGISLTIIGSVLVSLEDPIHNISKFQSKIGFLMAILASGFFAARALLFKSSSGMIDFWNLIFWIGLSGVLISLILLIFNSHSLKNNANKGLIHLLVLGLANGIGYFLHIRAIDLGPVSLVAAIAEIDAIIIFLLVLGLSKFVPKVMKENISKPVLIQKTVAIVLSFSGVTLIHLFS